MSETSEVVLFRKSECKRMAHFRGYADVCTHYPSYLTLAKNMIVWDTMGSGPSERTIEVNRDFIQPDEITRAEKLIKISAAQAEDHEKTFMNDLFERLCLVCCHVRKTHREDFSRSTYPFPRERDLLIELCRWLGKSESGIFDNNPNNTDRSGPLIDRHDQASRFVTNRLRKIMQISALEYAQGRRADLMPATGELPIKINFEADPQAYLQEYAVSDVRFKDESLHGAPNVQLCASAGQLVVQIVGGMTASVDLTSHDSLLLASNADPEEIRAVVHDRVLALVLDAHFLTKNAFDFGKLKRTSIKDYPFIPESTLTEAQKNRYSTSLRESGAESIVHRHAHDRNFYDPFKTPYRHGKPKPANSMAVHYFNVRYRPFVLQMDKEFSETAGDGFLPQALSHPAQNAEELTSRQTLLQTAQTFIESPGGKVFFEFLSLTMKMLNEDFKIDEGMQSTLSERELACIAGMLNLDFAASLAPLLALENPFFRNIAENVLANSELLKAQWRTILQKSEAGQAKQDIIFDPYFSFVRAFYPAFSLNYIATLVSELGEYKEYLRDNLRRDTKFCNAQAGDEVALRGVIPIIGEQQVTHGSELHWRITQKSNLVPLTLEMPQGSKILVISGPNMGGKSTVLRTLELTQQIGQAGLPVAVTGLSPHIQIPTNGVLHSMKRQQDRPGQASTFQRQITDLGITLNEGAALLLFDEYGLASTEPAQYLLDEIILELIQKGTPIIIAVQDGSVRERLRILITDTLGADTNALERGHMTYQKRVLPAEGADRDAPLYSVEPLYKFALGVPAFEEEGLPLIIARDHGIPKNLTDAAEARYLRRKSPA